METTNIDESMVGIKKFTDSIMGTTNINMNEIIKETYTFLNSCGFFIFDGSALVSNDGIQEVVKEVSNIDIAFVEKNDDIVIEI